MGFPLSLANDEKVVVWSGWQNSNIAKMSAISFNFINDKEKEIHVGTIAQEWEKILPEVVRKGMDGYLSMDYSATALVSAIVLAREAEKQKD